MLHAFQQEMKVQGWVQRWVRQNWRDPIAWSEVIQVIKTVVAAVLAWVIAADMLGLPQPFLAPWAALLVVHSTVYRTLSRGVKQVAATVIGVVFAWGTGNLFGLDPLALTVMLLAAVTLGHIAFLREENTTIAATALIVLTTGYSEQDSLLIMRLLDTAIGVVVGLGVNVLVWPPFRDRAAARAVDLIDDKVGVLICDMAADLRTGPDDDHLRSWVERSDGLDSDIDQAGALVRQARESGRLNPRRSAGGVRQEGEFGEVLARLEQAVADIRSMARTLQHSVTNVVEWDPKFRDSWLDLLEETGRAIGDTDSARLQRVRNRLERLGEQLSTEHLPDEHWPEYGGLITNLRNILSAMDVVADENPIRPSRRHRPVFR